MCQSGKATCSYNLETLMLIQLFPVLLQECTQVHSIEQDRIVDDTAHISDTQAGI